VDNPAVVEAPVRATEVERHEAVAIQRRRIIESALVPTAIPNLAVLPTGATPPNPAELLGSTLTDDLLGELSAMSDIVIIDTPPLMAVADPAILAEKSDGVLLVAAVGDTSRDALARGKAILVNAKARVLGVALNKVEAKQSSYYYGYYR
jgi:capsular exopolysaccharide synthesis family protein